MEKPEDSRRQNQESFSPYYPEGVSHYREMKLGSQLPVAVPYVLWGATVVALLLEAMVVSVYALDPRLFEVNLSAIAVIWPFCAGPVLARAWAMHRLGKLKSQMEQVQSLMNSVAVVIGTFLAICVLAAVLCTASLAAAALLPPLAILLLIVSLGTLVFAWFYMIYQSTKWDQ